MRAIDCLIGNWVIDQNDKDALKDLGNILISFSDKGVLYYRILEEKSFQVIVMTYKVVGDKIITAQPSSPSTEKTSYRINDNTLVLELNNAVTKFIRLPK